MSPSPKAVPETDTAIAIEQDSGLDAAAILDLPTGGAEPVPSPSGERAPVARWYAVQVASSCEKKVKATLEQRAVTLGVDNRILEIEIPQTPGVWGISMSRMRLLTPRVIARCSRVAFTFFSQLEATCTAYQRAT